MAIHRIAAVLLGGFCRSELARDNRVSAQTAIPSKLTLGTACDSDRLTHGFAATLKNINATFAVSKVLRNK